MSEIAFWGALALIGYTYAGFPLLVLARARLRPRAHRSADIRPPLSILVAAHDEEDAIGAKLDNVLATDYPADRRQVVVASDGSTDRTVEIARRHVAHGVLVLDLPRVGKAAALDAAAAEATGEILVFTDSNSMFDADALAALVAPFADPEVGGVAGNQVYLKDGRSGGEGERSYWDVDRILKLAESEAGNVISATGAIYAVRRSLFRGVPVGVTDDFAVSTDVVVQGHRLVFAPAAIAREPVAPSSAREYRRKVRIMTRGLTGVALRRELLDPRRHGFYAIQMLTHKLLRRLMVYPLIVLAGASLAAWQHGPIYRLAALGQAAFYGLAAVATLAPGSPVGRHRLGRLAAFFCMVNAAAFEASLNVLRGRRIEQWRPERGDEAAVNDPAAGDAPAAAAPTDGTGERAAQHAAEPAPAPGPETAR